MSEPIWPSAPHELRLCLEAFALATISTYWALPSQSPGPTSRVVTAHSTAIVAAIVAGGATLSFAAPGTSIAASWGLSAVVACASLLGVVVRHYLANPNRKNKWVAEFELAWLVGCAVAVAALVGFSRVGVPNPGSTWYSGRIACVLAVAAVATLTVRAGTLIVRGILGQAGMAPSTSEDGPKDVDTKEYNRGRVIGNLERLLMTALIALGSYEALGLLVGAKGLIRGKELEQREFAEYFIVGTLTSVSLALAFGIFLKITLPFFWALL